MSIVKDLDIKEDGANFAVVKFGSVPTFEIKFNDHYDYPSFEKAVQEIEYCPEGSCGTGTNFGIRLAFNEMFNESNGMRPNVPNALIFMTDGDCNHPRCTPDFFKVWNKKYTDALIKLIGIGIGNRINETEIKMFVGEDNYVGSNITTIIDPEFQKNLTICDSKFLSLSRILIKS